MFSFLLYRYTAQHLRDGLEDNPAQTASVEQVIDELQWAILVGDGVIIVGAGFLGYWLAGKTLAPIQIALDAQEQFSANASHELRTPLSVVKTDLEIFLKKQHATVDDAKAVASRSLEEVDRMSGMVENILTLARSKKQDVVIEFEEVSIARPVEAAVKKLQHSAATKHLSLVLKKERDALVHGNERMLEQLFFNLIQNAISYTESGGIVVTIAESDMVTIKIEDTGVGITKDALRHVFEAFYKADEARSAGSGVGLGLAIVKEIVEKHQGTINIESELRKGTVVTVSFPKYAEMAS